MKSRVLHVALLKQELSTTHPLRGDEIKAIKAWLAERAKMKPEMDAFFVIDFGPGCQVMRIFVTEDPKRVRYRIAVWGTLCFHVWIDLEDELRKVEPTFSRVQGITLRDDHGKMLISPYLRMVR